MNKFLIILLVILVILVILIFTGKKSVRHEITINATPEKVWQVLTNTSEYPNWNPTMQLVKGDVKVGNQVTYKFTQDANNSYEVPITVKQIIPNELLNQAGGYPFILAYNHKYILEPQGNGTKVIINEDYSGIGVNFWNPAPVEKAYGTLNEALKKRAEE